ncbi:YveK family protein [Actinomycetospora sp. C-140]
MTSEDPKEGSSRPTVSVRRFAAPAWRPDPGPAGRPSVPGARTSTESGTDDRSHPLDDDAATTELSDRTEGTERAERAERTERTDEPGGAAEGGGSLLTGSPPGPAGSGAPGGSGGADGVGSRDGAAATRAGDAPDGVLRGRDVRRLGVIGLVIVVLGALVGFGASFLWPAQYLGRATVLYVISQDQPTGFLREDRNLTTQQLLMSSNAVTAPVAGQFGLTAEDLQRKMTVTLADGSELLTVDVRDPSQDLAVRIAAAVSTQYLQVSAASQPVADQARFLQDQLNVVAGQINALQTANTPASLAQLPAVSLRQSQLAQQLDQVNLVQIAQPTARLVVPAFPVGQVSPRPWFGAATGAVAGLIVAIVTVAVLARRRHRAARSR